MKLFDDLIVFFDPRVMWEVKSLSDGGRILELGVTWENELRDGRLLLLLGDMLLLLFD